MGKPRGSIKTALMEIIRNPDASPKDRIAASDRLQRIRKQKPRGRHVKKGMTNTPEIAQPITPSPMQTRETIQTLTQRDKIQALVSFGSEGLSAAQKEYLAHLELGGTAGELKGA